MNLFQKLFSKNWEPLLCRPDDIIGLFKECLDIDAPIAEFIIEYKKQKHHIGMTADYSRQKGFFDIEFYLDEQHFLTLEDFCVGSMIDGVRFLDVDTIKILEDIELGDPRNNTFLQKHEIS